MPINPTSEFTESQSFNQWWLWALLIGLFGVSFYGLIQQLILEVPLGSKPLDNTGMIALNAFNLGLMGFFKWMRLDTRIDRDGIRMRFVPFLTKFHSWEDIQTIEVVHYGFVGGWGIRLFTAYGTVYNMRGAKGLAIRLKSGKKFLIGSQRSEALNQFIEQFPQKAA